MNIGNINNASSTNNFGMALKIKPISKKCGQKVAQAVESKRPQLEELAKDVDVFIKPTKFIVSSRQYDYLEVVAQEKNITLFDKIKSFVGLRPPYKTDALVPISSVDNRYVGIVPAAQRAVEDLKTII